MAQAKPSESKLLEKIRSLPSERVNEVEDFVDFLRLRNEERSFTQVATKLSEESFAQIWNNPDDADYDRL